MLHVNVTQYNVEMQVNGKYFDKMPFIVPENQLA
jgi:hypothetical protein